jgi:Spy/CpxP family protein refolding chaperone
MQMNAQDKAPAGQPAPAPTPERAQRPVLRERLSETRERQPGGSGGRTEGLTPEQQDKIRQSSEKMREEQRALYDKLRAARTDLEKTAQADPINETDIRAKAAVIGQIEGELALIRARHYKELAAVLPKEQMDRFREAGPGARFGAGATPPPPSNRPPLVRPAAPGDAPRPVSPPAPAPTPQPKQ